MAETKDWQNGKILKDRLHYMLTNEIMCDVTFMVGQGRTPVKAHKFMLASASPVFQSMFDGPIPEKGDVIIPDISVDVFKDILKFIYTDEVDVNANNIRELTYGSDKYIMQVLKEKCSSFLQANINIENACVVLQTANDFHLDTLRDEALPYILKTGIQCLVSDTFLKLSPECVKLVIESGDLRCTEEVVYERMVKWAVVRCEEQKLEQTDENIRKVLGELLYLIRFPAMSRQYFTANISKKCLLSSDEKVEVYQSYDNEDIKSFSLEKRRFITSESDYFRCEVYLGSAYNHNGYDDCIDFSTNFNAYLSGIYVFGSNTYSGQHDVKVDVLQSGLSLESVSTKLTSVQKKEIYLIEFTNLINVCKDKRYSIKLNMKGGRVFYGQNYKTTDVTEAGTVSLHTSDLPSPNGTTDSHGQIPGIRFISFK